MEEPDYPICEDCLYGDDGEARNDQWLLCRMRAPIALEPANDGFVGGDGVFPRVRRHDHCGEWRANKPPYERFIDRLRQHDEFERKRLAEPGSG